VPIETTVRPIHRRNPESLGQTRPSSHEDLGADEQRDQTSDEEQDGQGQPPRPSGPLAVRQRECAEPSSG
jgi:hypothetical protein